MKEFPFEMVEIEVDFAEGNKIAGALDKAIEAMAHFSEDEEAAAIVAGLRFKFLVASGASFRKGNG